MSTLLEIRTQLVKESGHEELVVDAENGDYSDNGADTHINAASRWLDRKIAYKKDQSWLTKTVTAGNAFVTFSRARYIEHVEIATTADGRMVLERVSRNFLAKKYADVPLSSVDRDTPLYWAPAHGGLAPHHFDEDDGDLTGAGIVDIDFYQYGNHYLTDGIIIMPPPDKTYTIKVLARWLSKELGDDDDVNFWTVSDPDILVLAAKRQIEAQLHRNREGVREYTEILLDALEDIALDLTAEEMAGPPEQWVLNG